ncbi:MAG: minor capsid protein [Hydrogenoanaerobacterium sp.]
MTRWFGRAKRDMQKKITDFYMKYAEKNSITLPCAKAAFADRRAVSITLEESLKLAQKIPMDTEFARLLDKAYIGRAISREEFLKMQLDLLSAELYNRYAEVTKTSLTCVFEDSYYKSLFDYQQFIGYGSSFNRISTHQIEAAVTTAWQGKNYSQRIWGTHRPTLARYLNRIVTTGFIEGSSGENMTAQLGKAMDMSAYEARRLIRTECSQVSSRANLLAYKENCTERFEFLAVLDYKTSERCRVIDGKIFNLSEAKIGINMPPLHPFCRSTTVPYLPDAELDYDDTRTARGADGESYKVPAKMKYREWHKAYVENHPAEVLTEKKYKHGSADAAQYDKYMKLLGHDAPKSFDEFQNLKYTDRVKWKFTKLDYRRRNRLKLNLNSALPNAVAATAANEKFTQYLFDGNNLPGLAKGRAITHCLGYDISNWEAFKAELLKKAKLYCAKKNRTDKYGESYEQKVILNGLKGTPANIIVAWKVNGEKTWLTSAYIKEVEKYGN